MWHARDVIDLTNCVSSTAFKTVKKVKKKLGLCFFPMPMLLVSHWINSDCRCLYFSKLCLNTIMLHLFDYVSSHWRDETNFFEGISLAFSFWRLGCFKPGSIHNTAICLDNWKRRIKLNALSGLRSCSVDWRWCCTYWIYDSLADWNSVMLQTKCNK